DFKYLPANTELLVVIRMDQLNASAAFKRLCKEFPTVEQDFKRFGLELANIQCVVAGGSNWTNGPQVEVIKLKNSVAPNVIVRAMGQPHFVTGKQTNYKEEKV